MGIWDIYTNYQCIKVYGDGVGDGVTEGDGVGVGEISNGIVPRIICSPISKNIVLESTTYPILCKEYCVGTVVVTDPSWPTNTYVFGSSLKFQLL